MTPPLPGPTRWALRLAIGGALLGILGDSYHVWWATTDLERSDILATPLYRAHGVAIGVGYALALAALAALLARAPPSRLGAAGALLAFVATPFVIGDYWAESIVTPALVAAQPTLADADAAGLHLFALIAAFGAFALGWALVMVSQRRGSKAFAVGGVVAALAAFSPLPGSNVLLFVAILALCVREARIRPSAPTAS